MSMPHTGSAKAGDGGYGKEKRFAFLFCVYMQMHFIIRPTSARYMHKKEITAYEKENPDIQE